MTRFYSAGERVSSQGSDANAMFVIVQGTVTVQPEVITDATSDKTGGGASVAKEIYQAGDDFGALALVDDTFRWPGNAVVVSPRAMIIVLYQTDLQDLCAADRGLGESVGELVAEVARLRSPSHLSSWWPFYGASSEAVARVSSLAATHLTQTLPQTPDPRPQL